MKSIAVFLVLIGSLGLSQGKPPDGATRMRQKLKQIRIPEIAYDDVLLYEILPDLEAQALKNDPDQKGVKFRIKPGTVRSKILNHRGQPLWKIPTDQVKVRVKLPVRGLTLSQILDVILRSTEAPIIYEVDDTGIIFCPDNTPMKPAKSAPNPAGKQLVEKVKNIRLTLSNHDGQKLEHIIAHLLENTRSQGINFLYVFPRNRFGKHLPPNSPGMDAMGNPIGPAPFHLLETIISIKHPLGSVSLAEALDAITRHSNPPIQYEMEDYGIVIKLRPPPSTTTIDHRDRSQRPTSYGTFEFLGWQR